MVCKFVYKIVKTVIIRYHPCQWTFLKLFYTFDNIKKMIKQCQFHTNVLPMYRHYAIRRISFLSNLQIMQNQVLQTLHESYGKIELLKFAWMFEGEVNILTKTFRAIIRIYNKDEGWSLDQFQTQK